MPRSSQRLSPRPRSWAAKDAYKAAGDELADVIRAAYADGEQQSAILKAIKMVWSREYIRIVLGLTKKRGGESE